MSVALDLESLRTPGICCNTWWFKSQIFRQ